MASVSLEEVSKSFRGGRFAVRNLSLEVLDHQLTVFVGPSGCGKSTTLRLIAGLEVPSRGTIRIGDQVVCRTDERGGIAEWRPPDRRRIGMVFQHSPLYPHLTVRQNMEFGSLIRSRAWLSVLTPNWFRASWLKLNWLGSRNDRRVIDERIEELADWLEISRLLDSPAAELSGGERQRVALGRALVQHNDVVLLDEPFANLDAGLRRSLQRRFRAWQQRHRFTAICVTHDQAEALAIADRVVVINDGAVEQVGEASQLFESPKSRFVAGFVGEPPMNLLDTVCQQVSDCLQIVVAGNVVFEVSGENVRDKTFDKDWSSCTWTAGIRPQYVVVRTIQPTSERGDANAVRPSNSDPNPRDPNPRNPAASAVALTGCVIERSWISGDWYVVVSIKGKRGESSTITGRQPYEAKTNGEPNNGAEFSTGYSVQIEVDWSRLVLLPGFPSKESETA